MKSTTHILPGDTPVWLAAITAQREGKMLLSNGSQAIISIDKIDGFLPIFVNVKNVSCETL